jgi:hypothetical protein
VQLLRHLVEVRVVAPAEALLRRAVTLPDHVEAAQDTVVGDEGEGAVGAVDDRVLFH